MRMHERSYIECLTHHNSQRSYIDQRPNVDLVNFIRKRIDIHMIVFRMPQFLNLRFSEERALVIQSWPKAK